MGAHVQVDAARRDRSLLGRLPQRRACATDPALRLWRRLIDTASAESKRTLCGVATDDAIRARWWIEEHKPAQTDKVEWARSFACACSWLGLDETAERKRLVAEIDQALAEAAVDWARGVTHLRRAVVLTCAGMPTAVARQFRLSLFTDAELLEQAELFAPEAGLTLVAARGRKVVRLDRIRRRAA